MNKMKKTIYSNLVLFILVSITQAGVLSYKELEIEHDLENRFLQSLVYLIGKDQVFLEVDISLGEIKSNVQNDIIEHEPRKPPPVTNLPGFSNPNSPQDPLFESEELYGIITLDIKMVLDTKVSKKLENVARNSIINHPVFTSVSNANLVVQRFDLIKRNPESFSGIMENVFDKYDKSLAYQHSLDSLRTSADDKKISLLSSRSVLAYISAGIFAVILLLGILVLLRGMKKVSDKTNETPEISVNIPPPPAPAQESGGNQQITVSIDQPIELLPPSEGKTEELSKPYAPFKSIQNLSNDMIWKIAQDLEKESLEILITNLPKEKAVALLSQLDDDQLKQVSLKLSKEKSWSRSTIDKVRDKILKKYNSLINPENIQIKGASDYADILNSNPAYSDLPDRVLALIGDKNSALREEIFPFSDLAKVDDEILKNVLLQINRDDISTALWQKDEEFSEKILHCLNPETAKNILKRIKILDNVNSSQIFTSERRIVQAVKLYIQEEKVNPTDESS